MVGPMWNAWVKARKEGRPIGLSAADRREMEQRRKSLPPLSLEDSERIQQAMHELAESVDDWGV